MNHSRCRMHPVSIGLLGILFLLAQHAPAQSVSWTNAASGNWSAPGNWNPSVPPGPGTNAFITNSIAVNHTITNDVLNNTFNNLTVYSTGGGTHTIYDPNGFDPAGNVILGSRGVWLLNGAGSTVGGSVTISNLGTWSIINGASTVVTGSFDNAGTVVVTNLASSLSILGSAINRSVMTVSTSTVNVGGIDASSANASFVTFTNRAGATITLGGPGGFTPNYNVGTINASTQIVGFVNQGNVFNFSSTHYVRGLINATVFNDTNGVIETTTLVNDIILRSIPTNRGLLSVDNSTASMIVQNGNVVNEGTIRGIVAGGAFSILNGSLINNSNVLIRGDGFRFTALSTLNNGRIIITNTQTSSQLAILGGPVTNNGLIQLHQNTSPGFSGQPTVGASNFLNNGTILAVGRYGTLMTNALPSTMITSPVTNRAGGMIISSNGASFSFNGTLVNQSGATLQAEAGSLLSIGASPSQQGQIVGGTLNYRNDGIINLKGGSLGVALLTNAAGAALQGNGDIGRIALSNLVSGSGLTTNFVRHFLTRNIVNSGLIAPNGALNAGAITNLSGGQILGFGTIQSLETTNSYSGEALVTTTYNTGARIFNDAGATLLASGGTLVLSNGLVDNSNVGTLGASNGVLQLGNGTLALTNNGILSVHNGGLSIGDLRNNGTVQIVNSIVTYSNKVVTAGRYISDPSTNTFFDDVTVLPSGTLEGGMGDVFDFKKSLFINSTNTVQFNLVLSTVSFSGGGNHTNAITGLDFDTSPAFGETHGFQSTNFAYGILRLGASDNLYFVDGDGNPSNANGLYIGVLDMGGITNNVSLLHSPFNIYYTSALAENAYLGSLTYALDGGGFLIPIPEPSTSLLAFAAAIAWMHCRRARR